jgi:2-polyprenyl-3-methyl-5-hydroxy-6-metoxy-1,4-benzoquinol methylase
MSDSQAFQRQVSNLPDKPYAVVVEEKPRLLDPSIYAREPQEFYGAIPVFSERDEYTTNYEQISGDHLDSLRQNGTNPFIREDVWTQMETPTRELIRKYAKEGDRILDVGVGLGRLMEQFPTLQRYGIDISFGYLEIAQTKGIEVSYALIEDMPFQDEIFDLAVSTDVLEHVLDLNLCCRKILATLKKGGVMIARVPYRENLAYYASPNYPYKYVHLRNFDEHTLRLMFERILGCEVLEMIRAPYVSMGSRLKYRLPIPKQNVFYLPLLAGVRMLHKPTHQALLRMLYEPLEINVVLRKPA